MQELPWIKIHNLQSELDIYIDLDKRRPRGGYRAKIARTLERLSNCYLALGNSHMAGQLMDQALAMQAASYNDM